jgi:hypothetical protein
LVDSVGRTGQAPGKIPRPLLRAHYLATGWAIFDQTFAARCFRRPAFGCRHPPASAFFCHDISFLLVEWF